MTATIQELAIAAVGKPADKSGLVTRDGKQKVVISAVHKNLAIVGVMYSFGFGERMVWDIWGRAITGCDEHHLIAAQPVTEDSETLKSAVAILRKQEAKGRDKYGADLDSFTGTPSALSAHKVEELADALCYAIAEQQRVIDLEAENAALKARVAHAADLAENMIVCPQGTLWNYGTKPSSKDRSEWAAISDTARQILSELDRDRAKAMIKPDGDA